MALHLGLHWAMFVGIARKALHLKPPSRARKLLLPLTGAAIAVYGVIAFIRRDWLTYMLVRTHFVFLDFSEPVALFYLDCLCTMDTFVFLGRCLSKLLQRAPKRRPHP